MGTFFEFDMLEENSFRGGSHLIAIVTQDEEVRQGLPHLDIMPLSRVSPVV
jgi:hypothetical protein